MHFEQTADSDNFDLSGLFSAVSDQQVVKGFKCFYLKFVGIENYSSSASASSTPRDDTSSGSPSPIPDDALGKQSGKEKPSVKLGKLVITVMAVIYTNIRVTLEAM